MTFPATRLRRMRAHAFSRRLMQETTVTTADLIWPVFVIEGDDATEEVSSMPGVRRMTIDHLLKAAEHCLELAVPAIALFPAGYLNRYRFPKQAVVERYAGNGTNWYQTGLAGAITVQLGPEVQAPEISLYREQSRRYWMQGN